MTRTCSRILTCALALSLLIHLMFAAVIKPIHSVEAAAEQQPTRVRIIVMHTPPPPTPTPPPTRLPNVQSRTQANAHPRVSPPRAVTNKGPGPAAPPVRDIARDATPGPAETAVPGTPEPTATPKPACSVPNAPAATVNAVAPSVPDDVGADVDAQAQVRVTLQPTGAVETVAIYRSAGNVLLDREALRAARQSTYRAEVRDCIAIRGDYLFTVEFKG